MSNEQSATVILTEAAQGRMADAFFGWQCRIRQIAMRDGGGRPSEGMRPEISLPEQNRALGQITVLISRRPLDETAALFRHMAKKTQDPKERLDSALKHLQGAYYQRAREFTPALTALFGPESQAVKDLLFAGRCLLRFSQFSQSYSLPCDARLLPQEDELYQATYWHNALFNPNLPGGVQVLAFHPDWSRAAAEPPIT